MCQSPNVKHVLGEIADAPFVSESECVPGTRLNGSLPATTLAPPLSVQAAPPSKEPPGTIR